MSVRTAVPLILLAVGAAACGSSSSSASTAVAASPSPAPATRSVPGTSGKLASVAGSTLEVQGTDGQTTVTYSGTTTFTQTGAATRSDLAVGDCVQASATGARTTGAFTATRVVIESTSGTCAGGFGGGFGNRTGAPRPSGSPRPRRSFAAGAGLGARAAGSVTSVSGDTFVIKGVARNGGTAGSTTVTVSGSTTYTRTIRTAADALLVGKCVTALGRADSTGAVAATSINVRDATNGSCTTGFGGRGFGAGANG